MKNRALQPGETKALFAKSRSGERRLPASLGADESANQMSVLVNVFSLVALATMALFSIQSLQQGLLFHLIAVATVFTLTALNFLIFRLTRNSTVAGRGLVGVMSVLSLYLLLTGGVANTGVNWLYVYPLLVLYLLGSRRGIPVLACWLALISIFLYLPGEPLLLTSYAPELKIRIIGSLLVMSVLAALLETSRERVYGRILELTRRLDLMSRTDELTGLPNRRDMSEQLQREHYRYNRTGHEFSLLLADVDLFKRVNDSRGHRCGDQVLTQLGALFPACLKKQDYVGRWGGEEFLFLLPLTDASEARSVAERLRKKVENTAFQCEEAEVHITLSFGVSTIEGGWRIEDTIHRADVALYKAKRSGRNRVEAYQA